MLSRPEWVYAVSMGPTSDVEGGLSKHEQESGDGRWSRLKSGKAGKRQRRSEFPFESKPTNLRNPSLSANHRPPSTIRRSMHVPCGPGHLRVKKENVFAFHCESRKATSRGSLKLIQYMSLFGATDLTKCKDTSSSSCSSYPSCAATRCTAPTFVR